MKKMLVVIAVGALLFSPAVGLETVSSVYAKTATSIQSQKVYKDVKITGIEDMTSVDDRVFSPDMVKFSHDNGYRDPYKGYYDFQSLNGTTYRIQAYGHYRQKPCRVGFSLFKVKDNSKGQVVYTNEPRFAEFFSVYKMPTSEPTITLWAVVSDRGAANSFIISGFYVFMDKEGVVTPVVTDDTMANFGMAFDRREKDPPGYAFAHSLQRQVTMGALSLLYTYQYWYGNMAHAAAKDCIENMGYLHWSNKEQTFILDDLDGLLDSLGYKGK